MNIEYVFIWVVSFISLYLSVVWFLFFYSKTKDSSQISKNRPLITIAVPTYNQQKNLKRFFESFLKFNYPKEKLELIFVNDGSSDKSREMIEKFIKNNKDRKIILVNRKEKSGIKAIPVNEGLKLAKGEFFMCLDADTFLTKDSLLHMINHFQNKKIGAVITSMKVDKPKNIYEKVQHVEYLISCFMRNIMSSIGTLYTSHGATLFRTKLLRDVGGFDTNNLTEDLEIVFRIRKKGYIVVAENKSVSYTEVPKTFSNITKQRVRWFRGFIDNSIRYRDMCFNKKYGLFGFFQYPINVLAPIFLLILVGILVFNYAESAYYFIMKNIVIDNYLFDYFFKMPSIKTMLLSQDIKLLFPLVILTVLSVFMLFLAYSFTNSKLRHFFSIALYYFVYPYVTAYHWIKSIKDEAIKAKKKW